MGFSGLSPWHVLIVVAVFVLLFGARKLPDAARSLGRSMRILKAETKASAMMTPGMTCGRLRPGSTSSRVPELQVSAKPDKPAQQGLGHHRWGI